MTKSTKIEADFLDRLYAVAMEPERFGELVDIWHDRLNQADIDGREESDEDLRHLESHLGRAERLLDMVVENEGSMPAALEEKIHASVHPTIAIDQNGQIVTANDTAVSALQLASVDSVSRLPFDDKSLSSISQFCENGHDAAAGRAQLVHAIRKQSDRQSLISLSWWQTGGGRKIVLLRLIDFSWPEILTPLVRDAFDLTPAETQVMMLLTEGTSPKEIAAQREASLATVRSQIKSIYAKTGTHNQNEFMRLILGLSSLDIIDRDSLLGVLQDPASTAHTICPTPSQRHLLELKDSRVMEYADFGPPEGQPCLFLHTEFFGDVWPAAAMERAFAKNLRIIAPARPCYGRSTCPPSPPTPDQIARDYIALLDMLKVERVVVMSQVAGGISALSLAGISPGRVAACVFLAPTFPSARAQSSSKLPFFHRFLASVTERHPRMLEFVCRAGWAFHNRVGSRRFLAKFAHDHPADLKLLDNSETISAMIEGMKYCATNGYRGFFSDYRHMPLDPHADFLNLTQPIIAIRGEGIGEHQQSILYDLVNNHPDCREVIAQGGGHYLHFSHPQLIADTLSDAWSMASDRSH